MKLETKGLLLAALAAAAPFVAGCGTETDDWSTKSGALVNGQGTTARPEVAEFIAPGTQKICAATMISSQTFVTAANCISYAPEAGGGSLWFTGGGLGILPVQFTFSQGGGGMADDLAYGRLQSPVSITPAQISTVEPGAGWLTVMGYGCTGSAFLRGCSTLEGTKNYVSYWYDGSTPSKLWEPGDEGDPVFLGQLGDNGWLVRVTGGATVDHDYGADAVAFRPFMLAMDTAFNNDGISYRSQVQSYGWMQAVQNGNVSGTTGQSLRLEALQVWSPRANVSVCYTAYVQNVGWQAEQCDGAMAGTVGQSLRMEAVRIRLKSKPTGTNGVKYNAYLQGIGWQGWTYDNVVAGTTGQSRRIEAIMIQLY
jgi:Clostridial hydrophobic W